MVSSKAWAPIEVFLRGPKRIYDSSHLPLRGPVKDFDQEGWFCQRGPWLYLTLFVVQGSVVTLLRLPTVLYSICVGVRIRISVGTYGISACEGKNLRRTWGRKSTGRKVTRPIETFILGPAYTPISAVRWTFPFLKSWFLRQLPLSWSVIKSVARVVSRQFLAPLWLHSRKPLRGDERQEILSSFEYFTYVPGTGTLVVQPARVCLDGGHSSVYSPELASTRTYHWKLLCLRKTTIAKVLSHSLWEEERRRTRLRRSNVGRKVHSWISCHWAPNGAKHCMRATVHCTLYVDWSRWSPADWSRWSPADWSRWSPIGTQWQLTQLWTLRPTFGGREYKGSAFFFSFLWVLSSLSSAPAAESPL